MSKKIFRIDDISLNTDKNRLYKILNSILLKHSDCKFIFGISPFVCDMSKENFPNNERIYPKIMNALSDYKEFYKMDICGVPDWVCEFENKFDIERAGHGLIHVDHRLLSKDVQEISILMSCNISKSKIFIPPYNKWNKETEDICLSNNIELIKFESGWKHILYNNIYDKDECNKFYFHTHDFKDEDIERLF